MNAVTGSAETRDVSGRNGSASGTEAGAPGSKAGVFGRKAGASPTMRVGLISDTHGLLRPEAVTGLRGCNLIIHGGDIGGPEILDELASLAPTTAVRGNNDTGAWAQRLKETELIRVGEVLVYIIHNLAEIDVDPRAQGIRVVVSGHSHKPLIEERRGVLFVNPGSAGRRRFKLPIAVGELLIEGETVSARIINLEDSGGVGDPQD
jgi:putative phosphoesterase